MTSDIQVGLNVAYIRTSFGISQKALSESMRKRGHKWAQGTVSNVETGERPLRLTEAADLADALTVDIDALTKEGNVTPARIAADVTEAAWDAYEAAAGNFIMALKELRKFNPRDFDDETRWMFDRFADKTTLMSAISGTLHEID
jgi:transcriptional regulator with XRE-family HTH domain